MRTWAKLTTMAAGSVLACLAALCCCPPKPPLVNEHEEVAKGYYLVQQVNAYYASEFGAISTAEEAEVLADALNQRLVSAVEYGALYFHAEDIAACRAVAEVLQEHGIDLWLTSGSL